MQKRDFSIINHFAACDERNSSRSIHHECV